MSICHAACVASVVVVTLVVAPARAAQPDIERENLTGIREVNVVVEQLADDAESPAAAVRGPCLSVRGLTARIPLDQYGISVLESGNLTVSHVSIFTPDGNKRARRPVNRISTDDTRRSTCRRR